MSKVSEGDMAPDFTLPTDGDGSFTLSDKRGSPVILFFYPKDNTPGCTKEAVGFSEHLDAFKKLGCIVAGMSPDPVKNHDKFVAKHELTTPLISDEEKTTLEAYGVWVEKSMYGKKYMGVNRTTLIIDAEGKIAKAWDRVKVPGHVEEVLATAQEMFG
jgi:peroxiredoxin Q/BCP